ncbi:ABC transporter permease [Pseudonocardia eucalypti]|uniref:ABC transporter permease n=1 Tax=Pseudonocardia eucalypti TaxID=648755 RepID=A0ABP9Q846_9PSEU|nr:peptide/nickel transport system permease protein [Pseudonocardia eucalypti]
MALFLARRFANYLVLCVLATFLAFALASLTFRPLDQFAQRQPPPPPSTIEAKRVELRLDKPIPERFALWAGDALDGDFGRTVASAPISDELWRRAGISLRLFLVGTVIGVIVGVLLGVTAAIRQYKIFDHVSTFFSFLILSTPVFVIGTLLKVVWLPVNQAAGTQILYFNGESTAGFSGTGWELAVDRLQHLVLPTVAVALPLIAYYSRYQRSAMLDVLGSDFLRTAQAKGLTRRRALFTHGLRTALIPMATLFAFGFGLLVTGGVFTERIFGWFGMGDWLVYGVQTQDANIVATVTLFIAVLVLLSGWLSDLLYGALDPRVRVR